MFNFSIYSSSLKNTISNSGSSRDKLAMVGMHFNDKEKKLRILTLEPEEIY